MEEKKEEKVVGFCLRCKKKCFIKDAREEMTKNNLRVTKGFCPICATKICKIHPKYHL